MNKRTSVTPFANRSFGVGAIASEKDTHVLTWRMVDALLCRKSWEFQNFLTCGNAKHSILCIFCPVALDAPEFYTRLLIHVLMVPASFGNVLLSDT